MRIRSGRLARLTRRLCIDKLRRARASSPEEEPEGVEDRVEELTEALALREALESLAESCQEILDRFFARDESYRTIAEALDLPPGTIASRISRCLARLRRRLEETAGDSRLRTDEPIPRRAPR